MNRQRTTTRARHDGCPFGESIEQKRDIGHAAVIACARGKSNRAKRPLLAVQPAAANQAR